MGEVSVPAKFILLGEHAVVKGHPAIAIPVDSLTLTVEAAIKEDNIEFNPPVSVAQMRIVRKAIDAIKKDICEEPVMFKVESQIPFSSGLGSSAALSVAVARSLLQIKEMPATIDAVLQAAMHGETEFHGKPSGIDPAVITYNRPIFFEDLGKITPIESSKQLNFVIADSGERTPTAAIIESVLDQDGVDIIFDQIGSMVKESRLVFESGDAKTLGRMMDQNHGLLQQLSISTPKLDSLAGIAKRAGALGAKLSGAGRGGIIVAICLEEHVEPIMEALKAQGAVHVWHTVCSD